MSTQEETTSTQEILSSYPVFDLEYAFDQKEEPQEVTIHEPDADKMVSNWITMDVDTAVKVENVR